MLVPITALYVIPLTLIAIGLTQLVGQQRLATEISLLDGGDSKLTAAIRRHANFTEHVPLTILLLAIIELNGAPAALLHVLGVLLVISRIVHPLGIDAADMKKPARLLGALGTLLVTIAALVTAGWQLLTA